MFHIGNADCIANMNCLQEFLGSFAEVSACILFSGQLPTGRSLETEVQVKQQESTINGNAQLLKSVFLQKKVSIIKYKMQNVTFYNYYCIIISK